MIELRIESENAPAEMRRFEASRISIGRAKSRDLVLASSAVSSSHAEIVEDGGKVHVRDLGSTNGTFVNGVRIEGEGEVGPGDRIDIGDFHLSLAGGGDGAATLGGSSASAAAVTPSAEAEAEAEADTDTVPPDVEEQSRALKRKIHQKLIQFLDLRWVDLGKLGQEQIRTQTRDAVENILRDLAWEIPRGLNREELIKQVLDEALGLGPLEDLLADESVTEIMVNRFDRIYIERKGKLVLSDKKFTTNQAVLAAIERIVAPIGRRIDESSPMVDARLMDGSRVNAIIPPLALKGPSITIRKFNKTPLTAQDLVRFGAMTTGMANFLKLCVELRQNVIVSGGTGSGKTTLLNVLSSFILSDERIVTCEDSAELQLVQDHVVSLETRPPNLEGTGAVTIRDLVRNSLRMRPDRVVVGECRAGEALDMLQAMNTGHDGSMTTLHANSPRDALARLETLVLMAGMDLPVRAIRDQIASAVNIIIQQTRFSDGSRKVSYISEITGIDEGDIELEHIFYFKQDGFTPDGKMQGRHVATGYIPKFYEQLRQRGIPVDLTIFRSEEAA